MSVRRLDPNQPASFAFTQENAAWAKATIANYPPGKQASAVIPLLWRAQEQHAGWLPEPAIRLVADMLGMARLRDRDFLHDVPAFPGGEKGTCAGVRHDALHAARV
jgi:NADH:ubiquinone oxidoreductase subunit E